MKRNPSLAGSAETDGFRGATRCSTHPTCLLREAFKTVKQQRPFQSDTIVILPDSSFHRFGRDGIDPLDWAGMPELAKGVSPGEVGIERLRKIIIVEIGVVLDSF